MDHWKEDAVVFSEANITVVRCDPFRELVWIGDSDGRVASFYGQHLTPYVSFMAHRSPVRDIQISDKYVLSLGGDGVASHDRNGRRVDQSTQATGDALLLLDNNDLLVGFRRRLKRFELEPQIRETGFFEIDCIPDNVQLTCLSLATPNVAVGLSDGTVQVLEPVTFDPILTKAIGGHGGPLTDLDARKNIVATCGYARRRYGLVPDLFVMCFDTRARKPLAALSVSGHSGASFVRMHPKAPNHAIIVSDRGEISFLDSRDPSALRIKHAVVHSHVLGIDISPQGVALVIVENNWLHLWSSNTPRTPQEETYNGLAMPDPVGNLLPVGEDAPLSTIGLPYFNGELFSTWNPGLLSETGLPPAHWNNVTDPYLARSHATVRMRHSRYRRNSSVSVPRFLSEQERRRGNGGESDAEMMASFVELVSADDSASQGKVPKLWRQMFVHYSKFGVDDFDFSFYNHTQYSGLEPLTGSRFCNAVLQLYRWCPVIYKYTLEAFAENSWRDLHVTGELAIVMDMLVKAQGYHCRATNFMDFLQFGAPSATLHGVLFSSLLEEYAAEIGGGGGVSPLVHEIGSFVLRGSDVRLALKESIASLQNKPPYVFLTLDEQTQGSGLRNMVTSFGIAPRGHHGGYNNNTHYAYDFTSQEYRLQGYVAEVTYEEETHAVAVVRIENQWILFNDFLVAPISDAEALNFVAPWKNVRILMYGSNELGSPDLSPASFDMSWKTRIDTTLLRERHVVSGNRSHHGWPTETLQPDEPVPKIVALDAEFVLVRKEIAELHSDGSKVMFSPKKLSLARISVLRENAQVLFDDWIEATHDVLDYLTTYSGVEANDLNPSLSRFGLVKQQTATRRLWIMLNLGTKFVGHALMNDFRAINLYVPPEQLLDTFNIFYDRHLNGFRRMSLKFLMWAVLNRHVQSGNHDSVEDAVSALDLYEKYQEVVNTGELDRLLTNVALKGQQYNYRVPESGTPHNELNSAGLGVESPLHDPQLGGLGSPMI